MVEELEASVIPCDAHIVVFLILLVYILLGRTCQNLIYNVPPFKAGDPLIFMNLSTWRFERLSTMLENAFTMLLNRPWVSSRYSYIYF